MRVRKMMASLMACTLIFCCTAVFVEAAAIPDESIAVPKASGVLNDQISANTIVPIGDWFYLSTGDTITYNCTYTPKTASVDFGCIDADGVFYYLNCTNGSIDKSIKANQRGQYMLAIRNNSSRTIIVTGSVKY